MSNIEHKCKVCKSTEIVVIGVEEGIKEINGKQIGTVEITYKCNKCNIQDIKSHKISNLVKCKVRA